MDIIDIIKYIILGIIQGLTEPLPISSSGHLIIFKHLFNTNIFNDLNFEIIIHFGSLLAILYIFKEDIIKLVNSFIKYIQTKNEQYQSDFNYIMLLIIATIPAGIFGFFFKDMIEEFYLSNIKMIGLNLLITSFLLFIIRQYKGTKDDNEIKPINAFLIGLFQTIAIIPGISRSGATITGSLLNGLKKDTAIKFTFLLYIPISIASFILGISDIMTNNQLTIVWLPYLLGAIASTITTYYATKLFIKVIQKGKLIYFVYYCLIVGTLVILFI
ncbi:MAG: undecaprenyl-diphosphate phosphatase [Bacilli bacterium]